MIKIGILTAIIAAMSASGAVAISQNNKLLPERDVQLIIESNKSLAGLSHDEIIANQNSVYYSIYNTITKNIKIEERFTVLNNAFVVSVNSNDVDAIKNSPFVKSVTVNSIHWKKTINHDITHSISLENNSVSGNVSATTMNMPSETNEGEGTAIAILDNEFYFRAPHEASDGDDGSGWKHETFTELDSSVAVKYTYDKLTSILSKTNAKRKRKAVQGEEGSLYLNNKVPFYYDYGGTTNTYGGGNYVSDYDVVSELSYHGTHVASIAAGNADSYKGIAPKAQLLCMKVFTEYEADEISENLGFTSYSGAYDVIILKALEDCITLGVDGINMSLGSDLNDFESESITVKTLSKLAKNGILTAIAAGNSGKASYSFAGPYGNWTTNMVETGILSSYANCPDSMTVASGQPDRIYYEDALVINGKNVAYADQIVNRTGYANDYDIERKMSDLLPDEDGTFSYIYTGKFGASSDYNKIDASGKIVIVNRGVTSFESKYTEALGAGAKALIIVNNDPTANEFNFRCDFGDTQPKFPIALLLYKDKNYFDNNPEGKFTLIHKKESQNETPRTISSYSSDGATYDFDLKPEITTPGDSIKGAIPPQEKEDKELTPYSTYEYLSGTSMASPNYAGSQALILSNVSKDIYSKQEVTSADLKTIKKYASTVDMRLMSTAVPMYDATACPEENSIYCDQDNHINLTSPRMQGAGMVNLSGAISTQVYLEGYDLNGTPIGKSKIALKNNQDIAKGNIKLDVLAHNESNESKTYAGKLIVMRPATILNNDIVTSEYNFRGEAEEARSIPGISYFNGNIQYVDTAKVKDGDVIKISRHIEFWLNEDDWNVDHDGMSEHDVKTNSVIMEIGNYVYDSSQQGTFKWVPLESKTYMSTQDTLITEVDLGSIVIPSGDNKISLVDYSLTKEAKDKIGEIFEYGCAIEGYVSLKASDNNTPDLSIPYLGFYSRSDVVEDNTYSSAPVVEDFNFDKDPSKVYPSDLINYTAKTLVGKDNADMGSKWVAGYASSPSAIDTQKVLTNDLAFDDLSGFHNVGVDPFYEEYFPDAKNNIFVGDANHTNTMIIQQFVLRSVDDNYFEIKNSKNETVYKSVLEDSLFGETYGRYPLYKSHLEANYLSAGYCAHTAVGIIPLYNTETNEMFADGDYTITFNYLLAGTRTWVNKQYSFHIISKVPEVTKIEKVNLGNEENVEFTIKGNSVNYAVIGYDLADVSKVEGQSDEYKLIVSTTRLKEIIDEISEGELTKRLYLKFVNNAFGSNGMIIHFKDDTFTNYEIVQNEEFMVTDDFKYNADSKSITYTRNGNEFLPKGKVNTNLDVGNKSSSGGCGGNIMTTSIIITGIAICMASLLIISKLKRQKEE